MIGTILSGSVLILCVILYASSLIGREKEECEEKRQKQKNTLNVIVGWSKNWNFFQTHQLQKSF